MIADHPSSGRFKEFLTEKVLFGNQPTPELIAILTVYFVQGILGLARLAVSFFLKDDLGLSPTQVAALSGIAALPWVIKPVYGFLSDGLPLFGYRRRPYLIISGIMGSASWIAMATVVNNYSTAMVAMIASSLSVAISDVIADSLVAERARHESLAKTGSLQSAWWAASATGGIITAYLSGWLLEHFSSQTVFLVTTTFPLIVTVVAWLITEEVVSHKLNLGTVVYQVKQLRSAVTQKAILLPLIFIFIWQATPGSESAFFFFTTNELGFEPEFLGRVHLVTSVASLIGVWLYQRYFKHVPFRVIFGWTTVISALLGMTALILVTHFNRTLGIDDYWFSLGDSLILAVAGRIALMPVYVLCARLCPAGIEATLFALLMSVYNFGWMVSSELGAILTHWLGVTETNFENLWLLVLICNLSTLLPLPFLSLLPAAEEEAESLEVEEPINDNIGVEEQLVVSN